MLELVGNMVWKNAEPVKSLQVICERTLTRDVGGVFSTVNVRMLAPVQELKRWVCQYHITGMTDARFGAGADSFQAMQSALDGIRAYLDEQTGTFTWLNPVNDAGFPRSIPAKYGVAFSKKCETMIADAEAKLVGDLTRWRAKVARNGLIAAFGPIEYTRMADRK
jgi:hypothetical protein